MAAPTIPNGEEQFFTTLYEGNGAGQRVGKFVPFTDNGTIANSVIFNDADNAYLSRTNDAGDRDTFTISVWVKRCTLGAVQHIFDTYDGSSTNDGYIRCNADNTISTRIGTPSNHLYTTNRTFEDTSKWYHIMLSVNTGDSTAADRVKLYVDGDRITSFSTQTNAGSSDNTQFNYSSATFRIGSTTGGSYDLDGYLAEFNQVDGTALTPDTFGVTDTSTGRWVPKALTGITYGTNGFRLQFSSSSNFGDDTSGNTNDFSVSNLVAGDQTTDSPTQNFATFDSNDQGNNNGATAGTTVLAEGNTRVLAGSTPSNWDIYRTSKPVASGKYYVEVTLTSLDTVSFFGCISKNQSIKSTTNLFYDFLYGWSYATNNGKIENNNSGQLTYGSARSQGDVIGIAVDMDNGKLWFSENGTYPNSGNPATGANPAFSNLKIANQDGGLCFTEQRGYSGHNDWNFGQKSYTHSAPSGFSTVQQDNMPETEKGVSGLSWIKERSASSNHQLYDSSRGAGKLIMPSSTNAESTRTDALYKFLKGGYAVGDNSSINGSGDSVVAWNWVANGGTKATNEVGAITSTVQANTTAGFSIVEYTGTGGAASVGHGLSAAPEWMIFKDKGNSTAWRCYHKSLGGITKYIVLNTTAAVATASMWGAPTASAFIIGGTGYEVNESGNNYIAYCWHSVDGFSRFGSYEGNNSADGPFVYTGFKPAFVMIKDMDNTRSWVIIDSRRDTFNPTDKGLFPNDSAAEATGNTCDLLSNGFKPRSTGTSMNASSTYIYIAFAEHPFVGDGTNPVTAR